MITSSVIEGEHLDHGQVRSFDARHLAIPYLNPYPIIYYVDRWSTGPGPFPYLNQSASPISNGSVSLFKLNTMNVRHLSKCLL